MKKYLVLLIIVMTVFSTQAVAKKKLYKWVDENGNVSYSDQVPPERIQKEHQELSDQGVVLEKVGNARTKEEIDAERLRKKQLAEERKEIEKQDEIRENIIKSYTNENEIVRLKEERISALTRNIELAKQSLEFQQTSREQLLSMAADKDRNGQEVSRALKSRIEIIEEKIQYQHKYIKVKHTEIINVKEKFKHDITIYREAKNHLNKKRKL